MYQPNQDGHTLILKRSHKSKDDPRIDEEFLYQLFVLFLFLDFLVCLYSIKLVR